MTDPRRRLPAVDALLKEPEAVTWASTFGRETVKASIQRALTAARTEASPAAENGTVATLLATAGADLRARSRRSLIPVLNGTGVVLHTNLGRAPLAEEARLAQIEAAGYGNVEWSVASGQRGSRYDHCVGLVCELTGAEAAVVTNNNAAAVSLVVNEFANGREVVVSRGELVEIGGTFRIPDVVDRSGARLREVGTTNRTRISDYAGALSDATGLVLRVHPSNYRVEGFTERPSVSELVGLDRPADVPFVHDVGSGLLREDLLPGFPDEPTVVGSLEAGADVVTWSGDKLMGGPQAGLIAGSEALIGRLRKNPLLRAFRVDKTTLAALEATLMLYRDPTIAHERVPTLGMLRASASDIEARARAVEWELGEASAASIEIVRVESVVGGGAFPGFELASAGWAVLGVDADRLAAECRRGEIPLVGRIEEGRFIVDLRAIAPGEEAIAVELLVRAIARVEQGEGASDG